MKAELKRLHSPDAFDLHSWTPESQDFAILIQVMAAPEGMPGEEAFDLTLCTPGWISNALATEKIMMGRHLLVVPGFDFDQVLGYIAGYVASCEGETWIEVAEKLGRLGKWEFEDYSE
jgi:hypothetical protein